MGTTRLDLYNKALEEHLATPPLASLSEDRAVRHQLDRIWARGFVRGILEKGLWQFAFRTGRMGIDPTVTPEFGYRYGFGRPEDFVLLAGIADNADFRPGLNVYDHDNRFWYANHEEIYLRYVSDHPDYGGDLSRWPESFASYAAAELASRLSGSLVQSKAEREALKEEAQRLLATAKGRDAFQRPILFRPSGTWVKSRRGGIRGRNCNEC